MCYLMRWGKGGMRGLLVGDVSRCSIKKGFHSQIGGWSGGGR